MSAQAIADPAIIASKERRPPQPRAVPVPTPSVLAPPLLTTRRDAETGEFAPPINAAVQCVYATADGIFAVVPRSSAERLPVPPAAEGETAFPFSFETLSAIYTWAEKFGVAGAAPSPFAVKSNFIDFTLLLTTDWEKQFFRDMLATGHTAARLVATINAAEHFKMEGLLTFCITALGCALRSRSEEDTLKFMGAGEAPVSDAERAAVKSDYPWFAATTAAQVKKH